MNKQEILKKIETKLNNGELKTHEELNTYLTDLKDRGILTRGQANEMYESLKGLCRDNNTVNRMATRTPQRHDYDNGSAGFSQIGFLVLNLLTLILGVAMITLLNK